MPASVRIARKAASDPLRNFRFLVMITKRTHDPSSTTDAHDQFLGMGGFMSVAGLGVQTEAIPYREGGYNTTTHKLPAQSDFPPMTFRRGMFDWAANKVGPASWEWMKEIFHHSQGSGWGSWSTDFRTDVHIYLLEHPRSDYSREVDDNGVINVSGGQITGVPGRTGLTARVKFTAFNAWPTSVAYSDLDAGGNGIMIEQMTLVHEGLDVKWATDNTGAGIPVGS